MTLERRGWVPEESEALVARIAGEVQGATGAALVGRVEALADENARIHERECFNLNPATNVMNPRAEALLSSGMGSRPSLGYPGDKYEMGSGSISSHQALPVSVEFSSEPGI